MSTETNRQSSWTLNAKPKGHYPSPLHSLCDFLSFFFNLSGSCSKFLIGKLKEARMSQQLKSSNSETNPHLTGCRAPATLCSCFPGLLGWNQTGASHPTLLHPTLNLGPAQAHLSGPRSHCLSSSARWCSRRS